MNWFGKSKEVKRNCIIFKNKTPMKYNNRMLILFLSNNILNKNFKKSSKKKVSNWRNLFSCLSDYMKLFSFRSCFL